MAVANRFDRRNDYGDMTWERQEELRQMAESLTDQPARVLPEGTKACIACGTVLPVEQMVKGVYDMEWFCADCDYQMQRD